LLERLSAIWFTERALSFPGDSAPQDRYHEREITARPLYTSLRNRQASCGMIGRGDGL
jgi:hypothetical protein